jgi:hypothetical protein
LPFFFASLSNESNLGTSIVVIDDPIYSLDDSRTIATAQEIRLLLGIAKQVIVLSHSKQLLCTICQHVDLNICSALQIRRGPSDSNIEEWNINDAIITEHDRRHQLLREYDQGISNDSRQVAQSLRPLVEGFLRVAYPQFFPPGEMLGQFIGRVCQGLNTPTPILLSDDLKELKLISEYVNLFHHDTNPAYNIAISNINETQLHGFVQRVLKFTKRNP